MNQILNILSSLCDCYDISGLEQSAFSNHSPFSDFPGYQRMCDHAGNILYTKLSGNENAKKILIEAHLDTIGFCVKEITQNGFVSLCPCGGIDSKILPSTELMTINGERRLGVCCSVPPHLSNEKNNEKTAEIYVDFGFQSLSDAKKHIKIGDPIAFADPLIRLQSEKVSAPGLDNKAAVAALIATMKKAESEHDLYFLFSAGEETTARGVISIADTIAPDIAIVVDAGFALTPGLENFGCIEMNKGPSVSITDTLSRFLSDWVMDSAKKKTLPLQIVCEPGGTGTSATKLQLQSGSIPCVVISIPLKNMHTPSEIVSISDIELTVKLLCALISQKEIPSQEVVLIDKK